MRIFPFIPRIQFKGVCKWFCTRCKTSNYSQLSPEKAFLQCANCREKRAFNLQIWKSITGIKYSPPDLIIPQNVGSLEPVFFRAQLKGWLKLSCPECGHLFMRQVAEMSYFTKCTNTSPHAPCANITYYGVRLTRWVEPEAPIEAFPVPYFAGTWKSRMRIHHEELVIKAI